MLTKSLSDTIAALATPPGEGGLAVIRVSGTRALEIAAQVFKPARPGSGFRHGFAVLGTLSDGSGLVDTALALSFIAPHSYTGEDTVEFSLHGGPLLVRRTLEALRIAGIRPAEPGEFTRRAFLNGKMDLVQAESVADLIRAETDAAQKAAQSQLKGALSARYILFRDRLKEQLALIETQIDFSEDETQVLDRVVLRGQLADVAAQMEALLGSYARGRLVSEGARVAIIGPPNAGKSSLLNALCEKERVIVDAHPGTTRDIVEETILLGDLRVTLMDTAGLRTGRSRAEAQGIERALRAAGDADLTLLVLDASRAIPAATLQRFRSLPGRNRLWVLNKCDRPQKAAVIHKVRLLKVSAKTGQGIPELKKRIRALLRPAPTQEDTMITSLRQRDGLVRCLQSVRNCESALREDAGEEILALELRGALTALGALTGEVTDDDILNHIFSRFCIGK